MGVPSKMDIQQHEEEEFDVEGFDAEEYRKLEQELAMVEAMLTAMERSADTLNKKLKTTLTTLRTEREMAGGQLPTENGTATAESNPTTANGDEEKSTRSDEMDTN